MTEVKKEAKKKITAKEFGKMIVREGVTFWVGMFFGQFKAWDILDFLFRE